MNSNEPTTASGLLLASAEPFDKACLLVIELEKRYAKLVAAVMSAEAERKSMDPSVFEFNRLFEVAVSLAKPYARPACPYDTDGDGNCGGRCGCPGCK